MEVELDPKPSMNLFRLGAQAVYCRHPCEAHHQTTYQLKIKLLEKPSSSTPSSTDGTVVVDLHSDAELE
ncbi:hypothetical protein R1flu_015172 [Riccia fluitans]|uniref:Uncharacterized protein n=1 Tax=Riccia fluitans TaxID=41844 RepID=A0ABD1YIM1_9MARC